MSEFKVGNRVTVIGVTPNESFEGCKGTIVRAGVFHEWIVDVTFPDGNHDELGYDEFELIATAQPAPAHAAGEGDPYAPTDMTYTTPYDALAFHILNAKVGALPENTWRNDWTPAQTVNELVFEIGRLDHETDALRAQLAAATALADTRLRELMLLEGERNRLRVALKTVFSESQTALIDWGGFEEKNMPADKQILFRVFRVVDSALQAAALPASDKGE